MEEFSYYNNKNVTFCLRHLRFLSASFAMPVCVICDTCLRHLRCLSASFPISAVVATWQRGKQFL